MDFVLFSKICQDKSAAPPAKIVPLGRLSVIFITIVIYVLVWASIETENLFPAPLPELPRSPPFPPIVVPFLVVFTIVSFAYLVQLLLEALLSIVHRSGAKGLFFIFGAVIFVCAKALAFYASGIHEIGNAEPPVSAPIPPHNTPTPADFAAQLQIVVDWAEKHAGLGGWVGAVGAIVAILVAWALARTEYRRIKKQSLKRKRDEINLIGRIVSEYDNLVQKFAQAVSANNSTANSFKRRHANDAEMHSMRDLAHVPVTSWPSLDAYTCFKQYWFKSNQALDTSDMSPINREDAERKLKENDEGLLALRRALETALKYYK